MTAILDHFAIATPGAGRRLGLFAGVLGGTWAFGDDSPGFWWGELQFAAGGSAAEGAGRAGTALAGSCRTGRNGLHPEPWRLSKGRGRRSRLLGLRFAFAIGRRARGLPGS